MTALDRTLAALAEPTRRAVVDLLRDGPARASRLADDLGTSRPALSRHLRVLRAADLIEDRADPTDGRARLIHLRTAPLDDVADWLTEVRTFWTEQLDAFAAHLATPPNSDDPDAP